MRIRFARYLIGLTIALIGGTVLVGAVNLLVDPYGVWGMPAVAGVTAAKPAEKDNEMLFKAVDLGRAPFNNLIIGSSRVDLGLDPEHPALQDSGRTYNLGLVGGALYPTLQYLRHALYLQPAIRHVVFGLEFVTFNDHVRAPPTYDERRLERRSMDIADIDATLLSRDAVFDSLHTIKTNLADPNYRAYSDRGLSSSDDMRRYAEEQGMPGRFDKSITLYLNTPERFGDFVFSQANDKDLLEIVRLTRQHGIDLRVFIPPDHVTLLEALRLRGLWCAYQSWKLQLAEMTPFWDFSSFGAINGEPIANGMKWYWDAAHFRKPVGDLVLDRIFDYDTAKVPPDFGHYVTPDSAPRWLTELDAARRAWEAANASTVAWVAARRKPIANAASAAESDGCPAATGHIAGNGDVSRGTP